MPHYRLADLALPPNIISALRFPLAAAFPFVVEQPRLAVVVLALSGLTDVLDGFLARRNKQVTAIGGVVDPIADKTFAATVVITLMLHRRLPPWAPIALLSREILEAPLVLWVLFSKRLRGARREEPLANIPGKLATVVQFVAIMAAIAAQPLVDGLLIAAGLAGVLAGISYWRRELLRAERVAPRPPS